MALPVRIDPLPTETFQSWAHRLSAPYLVAPMTLIAERVHGYQNPGTLKNSELLRLFSNMANVEIDTLKKAFVEDIFAQEYLSAISSVKNLWRTKLPIKHCSTCWHEDKEIGRPQYLRREWLEAWRLVCSRHDSFLTDHRFETSRGGQLFSHKTQAFQIQKAKNSDLNCKSINGVMRKFLNVYADLYKNDPTRLQILNLSPPNKEFRHTKYHLNIEGFIQSLEILQINQYPVFKNNFMTWLANSSGHTDELKFPDFEPGSPRTLIGDMSNECKVAAIELIYPWFVKGKTTRAKAAKALVAPASPLKSSISEHTNSIHLMDPFSLILSCIRKDMWESTISFLASRNNILVPALEKHHDRLLKNMVA